LLFIENAYLAYKLKDFVQMGIRDILILSHRIPDFISNRLYLYIIITIEGTASASDSG